MTDKNVKFELKRLGMIVAIIAVFYVAVYFIETRTQLLTKLLQ